MPVKSYQADLLKRLSNKEYASEYLRVSFEETMNDGNQEAFLLALKNVIEANQSIAVTNPQLKLAEVLEVNHPLTIESLGLLLQNIGLTLSFQPITNNKS